MSLNVIAAIRLTSQLYNLAKKQGFLEIMTRAANGRFVSITKCVFDNVTKIQGTQITNTAVNILKNTVINANPVGIAATAVGAVSSLANNVQTEMVRRAVKENTKLLKEISSQIGVLSSTMKGIAGVAWLNSGLSLVNIGVSAVGFVALNSKLDKLSVEIDEIAKGIKNVEDLLINNSYIAPYKALISDSKVICFKVADNREISEDELVNTLKKMSNFLDNVIRIGDNIPTELLLQIVYDLLPVFTNLIILYYEKFFYANGGKTHVLHSEWMNIFEIVSGKAFTTRIQDFYYLNKAHNQKVTEITNCSYLMTQSLKLKVEDTLELLGYCENPEVYAEACAAADETAVEAAKQFKEVLMENRTEEDAEAVLRNAVVQAVGAA